MIEPLDLRHLGLAGAISSYLLEVPEPALVDPGPATCLDTLREAVAGGGFSLSDLRYVFLTHVHLDHAGVTGHLVALNPSIEVHLHEDAAPHVADPTRLVASARRVFGEDHDRLWGDMLPVPASNIRAWDPGSRARLRGLRPVSTPGHIGHHVAYLHEGEGVLLAGDCMGVVLDPAAATHPPTPPPAVDVAAWQDTLARLESYDPDTFGVAHFGLHDDFQARRKELAVGLTLLERRVAETPEAEDGEAAASYDAEVRSRHSETVDADRVERYFDAFSAANDWLGMRRYVKKRRA